MLVLDRRLGEKLHIGDNITITLLGIDIRGTVSLGIDAPRDVPIYRQEMLPQEAAPQESRRTH